MEQRITRVAYYHTSVKDQPGEAYKFLSQLAGLGINLVAFTAVPAGQGVTQLTIFPDDPIQLKNETTKIGLTLDGPHKAFLVQGDDKLGALVKIHRKIYEADVNVHSASGVTDGQGSFGYIVYVRPQDFEIAAAALGI